MAKALKSAPPVEIITVARPPGRPEFQPTAEQRKVVEAMTAVGIPADEIAEVIEISTPTLRKHFYRELRVGHIRANARVGQALYSKAIGGHVTAQIFWLKSRAGWREADSMDIGKKEMATMLGESAHRGTDWDELLAPSGAVQ